MAKRRYRAIGVKSVNVERLVEELAGNRAVIGIDVAKKVQFGAVLDADKQKRVTIRWEHTKETREFFGLCEALRSAGIQVEAVFEPSGTYGDAIRSGLQEGLRPRNGPCG